MTAAAVAPDPVARFVAFARALRALGVAADRARVSTCIGALAELDPGDVQQVYWAARVSLCSEPDDLAKFDALFDAWFRGSRAASLPGPAPLPPPAPARVTGTRPLATAAIDGEQCEQEVLRVAASDVERLRQHDIATLSDAERAEISTMIALLRPRVSPHRSLRYARGGRDRVDISATVRRLLRHGGEPVTLVRRHRREQPRRLVLLLDVSGSMTAYADVLLRFAHAAVHLAPRRTEVFTISTRLTRLTRPLRLRDPALALRTAATAIPDWSGGTRLGETLRAFLDLWGQRGTARGAVVVLASDGWERGDARLLGEQMARLSRLAHRVVWVNPHRGKAGFAPSTAGMVAALPHIDDLVAGHSLDAFEKLAEVIGRA